MALPQLPASHNSFIPYITKHPDTPVRELLQPYNEYEARLREVFAQSREDAAIQDPNVNLVPVYAGYEEGLKVRARGTNDEEENKKYIIPLKENRKESGSQAMTETFPAFKKNFNLFSESSLADLNWNNVVVAGSSVVNCLIPVSKEHGESTRALRNYYHEELAPSSDVDLFIWGLTEEQAVAKIVEIEQSIKDAILAETTTIRTRNAITIASQYPVRHIQIVLRLYQSVSEILTGFDVDSSCFAYDGSQVYGTPRGIAAFLTQCNTIDLSRRSPSYENRLFKYATRGFEIYCADLERARIDPTIYERAFARVQGLARLLVLERLPKESDRDNYRSQRRSERARPALHQQYIGNNRGRLRENFKDKDPQDIAEWVLEEQSDVSSYHSFTIPYGPRYNAKKIEKLVYTKDMLLNAEWNNKGKRTVNLHRHPCFVGDAEYIIHDCCTFCPKPETKEEKEVALAEEKIYVSGEIEFLKDDPGRQAIGSFNPLTSEDWKDQAYLGNTESVCQAIVEGDLDFVQEWCRLNQTNLDRRDHTGRTPLQLACQLNSVEMVRILVESGARMVARLADGLTALHIACINGNKEIVTILLQKSEANEEIESEKQQLRDPAPSDTAISALQDKTPKPQKVEAVETGNDDHDDDDEDDIAMDSDEELLASEDGDKTDTMTQGSFVKVKSAASGDEEAAMAAEAEDPDVYDVNILAWDCPASPLHLAIMCGHVEVAKLLVENFGADVLLPLKLLSDYDRSPSGAILTLSLAARNTERSAELTKTLLDLGASPTQSDLRQFTALHSVALLGNIDAMKIMMEKDLPKAKIALNHIAIETRSWTSQTFTPLTTAISAHDEIVALHLLEAGALPHIPFDAWAKSYVAEATNKKRPSSQYDKFALAEKFCGVRQPIIDAANFGLPGVVEALIDAGADVNQSDTNGLTLLNQSSNNNVYELGQTLLDIVVAKQKSPVIQEAPMHMAPDAPKLLSQHQYLQGTTSGTYQHWQLGNQYVLADELLKDWPVVSKEHDEQQKRIRTRYQYNAYNETADQGRERQEKYGKLRDMLIQKGAKTFKELYPGIVPANTHTRVLFSEVESDSTAAADSIVAQEEIKLTVDFEIPSVHEPDTSRYLQLFEAAWLGDKQKIRDLTTKPDRDGNITCIAVRDNMGLSPLHIALWRGDYDVAEMMLEIAHLQCVPPSDEKTERKYYIRGDDTDSEEYDSENEAPEDGFRISSDLVNQDFTIDDVAKLAQQTGSKTTAAAFLTWGGQFWTFASLPGATHAAASTKSSEYMVSPHMQRWNQKKTSLNFYQDILSSRSQVNKVDPLEFAIDTGDLNLVKLVFKWTQLYEPFSTNPANMYSPRESIHLNSTHYLFRALKLGQSKIASLLVSSSGCGMPIESLAAEAGIKATQATKYYQGLLLRGKHKQEWAKEANKTADTTHEDSLKTSLLLQAVSHGNIEAVEWCMTDSPSRSLQQWLVELKDDRIQELAQANGGIKNLVEDWLNSRRDLAIHMAVIRHDWESKNQEKRQQSVEILRYLIRVLPESLEAKNMLGLTPLSVAIWLRRNEAADILIAAGANQSTRDYNGSNLLHLAVNQHRAWTETDITILDKSLSLLDPVLVKKLSLERCALGPTGMTPLATWLWRSHWSPHETTTAESKNTPKDVLKTLLKHTDREALSMVDGGGQMPLHTCVKHNRDDLLEYLCSEYPELVLVENGMGQTALELCSSIHTSEMTEMMAYPAGCFAAHCYASGKHAPYKRPIKHAQALKILRKAQSEVSEKKRILISSLQASEVAKRLGDSKKRGLNDPHHYRRRYNRYGNNEQKYQDEVQKWLFDNQYLNTYQQQY